MRGALATGHSLLFYFIRFRSSRSFLIFVTIKRDKSHEGIFI
ncbi:hypothetical protein HMPREF9445_01111 [Bacteroides clarus YIT 12056]|uniref:Uncharacterized protein n=1 Tax=Bacteroides clarus YIT 12056 TaxID=762984 RepID=A0ABN0CPP5_9BACE|nr:hypothetical protein HMPREF9445_01111 [Bacteroides clarus YIT 12056]